MAGGCAGALPGAGGGGAIMALVGGDTVPAGQLAVGYAAPPD